MNIYDFRKPENDVHEIFIRRWSPRAMSGGEIDEATLLSLLEASRWAPSANNNQPWRFIYARRNTPSWEVFYNFRFPDPLLKPNGTSAWRSDQFVYQSVAVFWMTEVYFIQLLQ